MAVTCKPMPCGLATEIHHPMVSRMTRVEGAPDCRANWWKQVMNSDAVNPLDEHLQSLWMHMANLMGSDLSFHLASLNEKLEVK